MRVLPVQLAHIVYALPECALGRYAFERTVKYTGGIRLHERGAVQAGHEGAAVEAVTAVHDMAHAAGDVQRLRDHARGHQADEVGLDLEVQVVGVRVVQPVAGFGRHDALADVVAPRLIRVCEVIIGIGEAQRKVFARAVQSELVERFREGEVVVDVVEQAGLLVPPVFDITFAPRNGLRVRNQGSLMLELGGRSVDHAYGLAGPAALDFVHQDILGQGRLGGGLAAGRCKQRQNCDYAISLHKLLVP